MKSAESAIGCHNFQFSVASGNRQQKVFVITDRKHLNESSPAINWSFEALLLRGSLAAGKKSEVRSQKKYFYKYEMLPTDILHSWHHPLGFLLRDRPDI
ncbi:hypothetical protein Osc7112_5664 [Oscillatoria nigro-viridis PCC 7112]|uniref:Uncharacterized protein n=1 Tax=Phormidium nigroviride PCC 7112 TaxID=179408 RepID=K9VQQ1_9CYAN|nr:hypothetical protein [Oscillatoria nigro-viridis]AFZ09879.1 hypothetical protein Osc7112_5664 [Oscillatoria nigro-viridis PCC 7112]